MKLKMIYNIVFIFFLCALINLVTVRASGYTDYLTRGYADTLYCAISGNCILDSLTVRNLTITSSITNLSVTNLNTTGTIQADDFLFQNGDSVNDTFVNIVGDTMTGNLTIDVGGVSTDVELRLQTDVNENAYLYYMESNSGILGFVTWYDGSGGGAYKIDAIDGTGTMIPKMEIDRDDYDIDFFVNEDLNDNNITNVQCLELNGEYICDWDSVNISDSSSNNCSTCNISDLVNVDTTDVGNAYILVYHSPSGNWRATSSASLTGWIINSSGDFLYNDSDTIYYNYSKLDDEYVRYADFDQQIYGTADILTKGYMTAWSGFCNQTDCYTITDFLLNSVFDVSTIDYINQSMLDNDTIIRNHNTSWVGDVVQNDSILRNGTDADFRNLNLSYLEVNQVQDDKGIMIYGYDDMSEESLNFSIGVAGNSHIRGSKTIWMNVGSSAKAAFASKNYFYVPLDFPLDSASRIEFGTDTDFSIGYNEPTDSFRIVRAADLNADEWVMLDVNKDGDLNITANVTAVGYCNSTNCYTVTDFLVDTDTTINNCSVDNSCDLITYDSELTYTSLTGLDIINTSMLDNDSIIRNHNTSWITDNQNPDTTINNCSVDNSCDLITYDSELTYTSLDGLDIVNQSMLDNDSIIRNHNTSWITDNQNPDTTINNCSVDNSCSLITYDSELDYYTTTDFLVDYSTTGYYTDANITASEMYILTPHTNRTDTEINGLIDTKVDDTFVNALFVDDISIDDNTIYTADETNITLIGTIFKLLTLDLAEHTNSLGWITNSALTTYQLIEGAYKKANLTIDYPNLDTDSTNDYTTTDFKTDYSTMGFYTDANITASEMYILTPHTNRTDTEINSLIDTRVDDTFVNGLFVDDISIDDDTTYSSSDIYTLTPHTNRSNTDITGLCYDTASEIYIATPHTNRTDTEINGLIDTKVDDTFVNALFVDDISIDDDTIYDDTTLKQSIINNKTASDVRDTATNVSITAYINDNYEPKSTAGNMVMKFNNGKFYMKVS